MYSDLHLYIQVSEMYIPIYKYIVKIITIFFSQFTFMYKNIWIYYSTVKQLIINQTLSMFLFKSKYKL